MSRWFENLADRLNPREAKEAPFIDLCGEVADFYQNLIKLNRSKLFSGSLLGKRPGPALDMQLRDLGPVRLSKRVGLSPSLTVGEASRWLQNADRVMKSRGAGRDRAKRDRLKDRLSSDPALLCDLLHAFDRGDETYFLYLTRKVDEIGRWMGKNDLAYDDASEDLGGKRLNLTRPDNSRGQQAPPWDVYRRKTEAELARFRKDYGAAQCHSARKKHRKEINDCLEDLRRLELIRKVDSWQGAVRESTFEADVREVLIRYRPVGELESLVERKLEDWGNLSVQEHRTEGESEYLAALPDGIKTLIESWEKAEDEASKYRQVLIEHLFSSPKNQCSLALLLGSQPSRWLREEEAQVIEARRQPFKPTVQVTSRATDSSPVNETESNNADPTRSKSKRDRSGSLDYGVFAGLCFSGGGIRSATFNLGIMQALAELRLLEGFDYLSTVSGGGYIHQWLAAWLSRAGEGANSPEEAFETVNKALIVQPVSPLPGIEATQISFLRRFSNYLTPEVGFFSADTWTMFSTWARNTFLNQLVLFSGFLCIFAMLRCALSWLETPYPSDVARLILMSLAFLAFAAMISQRLWALSRELDRGKGKKLSVAGDRFVITAIVLLLVSAALYTSACLHAGFPIGMPDDSPLHWLFCLITQPLGAGLLIVFTLWPLVEGEFAFARLRYKASYVGKSAVVTWIRIALTGMGAGFGVFAILSLTVFALEQFIPGLWTDTLLPSKSPIIHGLVCFVCGHWGVLNDLVLFLAPPFLVGALFLCSVLHVGLNKQVFFDEVLEWMARLRSWGFLISFSWAAMIGCLILGEPLWAWLSAGSISALPRIWSAVISAISWLLLSNGGALAAKSGASSSESTVRRYAQNALVSLSPFIFMAGVFVSVSTIVAAIADGSQPPSWFVLALLITGSAVVFGLFGYTVDINEFSMFAFYRNRLARCYQGASVIERKPDPFTGFSIDDRRVRLGQLRPLPPEQEPKRYAYPGPFPIFCCTVNFTSGEDLAWQERKGGSFAYTPLYSGYDIPWTGIDRPDKDRKLFYNGFRDTMDLGKPDGPSLADVCAISGAAASPNAGYRTSPSIAFLLTCFNVRLGVWKRNTRYSTRGKTAKQQNAPADLSQSPPFAPWHLLKELFGQTNAKEEFLYLSDGGHFDNMGLYELVRRECRFIVVCDAEEDGDLKFEGIAMALRKCRTDFGAEIDLDLRAMRKGAASDLSAVHCVVGTILYPNEDPQTPKRDRGKIVYIKSTLTGSEPADVLSYRLKHEKFPHDTTLDQFFSESQFESYRVLGHYIAITSLSPAVSSPRDKPPLQDDCEGFFKRLYDIWYPVTPAIEQHLSNHGARLDALLQELRNKDGYAELAGEFFKTSAGFSGSISPEQVPYFNTLAISLLDFMWRVFNDLDLQIEASREHPHGKIWLNTFQRWARMVFVREVWHDHKDRYPASFAFFMSEHLKIDEPVPN